MLCGQIHHQAMSHGRSHRIAMAEIRKNGGPTYDSNGNLLQIAPIYKENDDAGKIDIERVFVDYAAIKKLKQNSSSDPNIGYAVSPNHDHKLENNNPKGHWKNSHDEKHDK